MLGRLCVPRWQCKACLSHASPLPPDVTSRQHPQTFRTRVTDLYVHSVRFRSLSHILDLLGCGVGAATLWCDVQAVAPGPRPAGEADAVGRGGRDLAHRGGKRPVAVVLGPPGRTAGPAPEQPWPRRGRLVHGPGRAGCGS